VRKVLSDALVEGEIFPRDLIPVSSERSDDGRHRDPPPQQIPQASEISQMRCDVDGRLRGGEIARELRGVSFRPKRAADEELKASARAGCRGPRILAEGREGPAQVAPLLARQARDRADLFVSTGEADEGRQGREEKAGEEVRRPQGRRESRGAEGSSRSNKVPQTNLPRLTRSIAAPRENRDVSSKSDAAKVLELSSRLRSARRVTVLTGAGVSAASGIPTFRGAGGLWRNFQPEELATAEAFSRDPATVWEWYAWRREAVARARPNRAHEVLAAWSRRFPAFRLITQNVDGLHERAGTTGVIRFHGSLWELGCLASCGGAPRRWRDERLPLPELPPRCPACGGLARPGVVWFGEAIDPDVFERSLAALDCEVCLVVGTSSVVYPAAGFAAEARRRGAFTAEINPEATAASKDVDLAISARAEVALDAIDGLLEGSG